MNVIAIFDGVEELEQPLEVGDRIEIGGRQGIVSTIEPVLRERELRLVVQPDTDGRTSPQPEVQTR